ncbi:unnamed protein product [Heligmosomoides polygyrus]|uniref:AAA_12 domain-containing protein n=1 Tax=Heligmosomoides polygyrus TaxID=6339 RepID=A0A183FWI0_HELPZ|nr:unnamed protein product [Heligmosomoides polygyrus]
MILSSPQLETAHSAIWFSAACTLPPTPRKELRAHMAEVIYIPPAPRVPFDIRKVPSEFSQMVQEKRRDFQTIKREPRRAAKFLDDLYSTTCGAIMALTAEQTDNAVYSVVWTPADINTYPAVVTFTIPLPHKSGWAVGNSIQGFFDVDEFSGTIHGVSQRENCLDVTAVLQRWDSLRWRRHALNSPNQRLAVGTCLAPEDDRANPTLALLEDQIITISWSASSPGWTSTQALLTTNVQLLGTPPTHPARVPVRTDKGTIALNQDQENAIDLFNHRFPIAVVESAYGAGKTLCAAVMAREASGEGRCVLIASIQNSAVDVIAEKIAQTGSRHVRPVRYISERVVRDTSRFARFDLANLMEKLHETHGDQEFAFSGTDNNLIREEHKELLYVERTVSKRLKKLVEIFFRVYAPNIILCTVASALNLTSELGLFKSWDTVILDEASMLPEAVLVTLLQRFDKACFTLIGDSKQLPPYIGIQSIPTAVGLCSQSALDVANRRKNIPTCAIQIVYRPHALMMSLNSEIFYDNALTCGTPIADRLAVLERIGMPNETIPVAFIDVPSNSSTSEAEVVRILVSHLLRNGFESKDISVICLYKDQKFLCESVLSGSGITVDTVDSAQGPERTVVILSGTPSKMSFFTDPRRLNVALSRARDGLFITGSARCLRSMTTLEKVMSWYTTHESDFGKKGRCEKKHRILSSVALGFCFQMDDDTMGDERGPRSI